MQLPLDPVTPFNIQALMNLPSTIIQPCDTWQSISMRLLGTDYSAYFHASGIPLSVGEQVTVPQLLSIYDKANSFTPEEKLFGAIYNALNPALKTPQYVPPPPPSHHHSFWHELIEAMVGIAIFAIAPQLIGVAIFGGLTAATVPAMITATMAGALASAAQQGVAIWLGDQQGFSAEQIVSYAATAGLTAGFSKALGLDAKLKAGGLENVAKVFIGTATLNATTQAFEIAIGMQHKFDVKLLIEQSIASLISGLSHALTDANVFTHILSPVTNDVINAGMGAAFGYPVDTEQLAADMLADEAVDTTCDALSSVVPAVQKTSIDQTKILEPVHFSNQSLNEESHEIDQLMHEDAGLVDHIGNDFLDTYENTLTTGIRAINAANMFSPQNAARRDIPTAKTAQRSNSIIDRVSKEVYDHQDKWWAKGILTIAAMSNSATAHMVLHSVTPEVAMDPTAGVRELFSGKDVLTGKPLSRAQGFSDTLAAMSTILITGSGEAVADVATMAKAGFLGTIGADASKISTTSEVSENIPSLVKNINPSFSKLKILENIAKSKFARDSSDFEIHSYVEEALFKLKVSTTQDTATFWSGPGNQQMATNFANIMEKTTLDMTTGGQYLDSLNLFKNYPYEVAIKPWDALSQRFAENANGEVYAFVNGANPKSVFYRIEYPTLLKNQNVRKIIFSPDFYESKRLMN